MRIFDKIKRQNEEDNYDEVEEVVVKRVPRNRAFRDLRSENKKKRKEPPKPWGKFERILVLIIVLITAGTSAVLALSARAWKLPGLPRIAIPRISISIPFFGEETIVFEGNSPQIVEKKKADKAIEAFLDKTESISGMWGLYVIRLSNGYSYGVDDDEVFQAASLIKLPLMAPMFREAEKGNLNLNDKYKLKSSDKVSGSGSLYGKPAGYEITYQNLIDLMGKQSDNTAFNICKKYLGDEKISEVINKIGMTKTNLSKNETSAKDIGNFFENLWKGNIVGNENKEKILDSLTNTLYENWLVAGIPKGIRVAHKYGREVHVINDAGIIYTEKPFVIVILSKGVVENEADQTFVQITKAVYNIEAGNY